MPISWRTPVKKAIIIGVAIGLLALGSIGYMLFGRGGDSNPVVRPSKTLRVAYRLVDSVAFSPDGTSLATSSWQEGGSHSAVEGWRISDSSSLYSVPYTEIPFLLLNP